MRRETGVSRKVKGKGLVFFFFFSSFFVILRVVYIMLRVWGRYGELCILF